jgi:phosphatidylglycerol:prolipoprotein diacylglycerol transferase
VWPVLIDLGFWEVPTYGLLLFTGIALGLWMASRRAGTVGLAGEKILDLGAWVVLWGLLGGKLFLVFTEPRHLSSLSALLGLFRAGGVFYGGLIGALVAAAVLMRRYRLPLFLTVDVLAPGVALGHFFGRLGCFAAGCCYGSHCDLPWAVEFTHPKALEISGTPLGVPLHPVQLYEAAFNLANAVFLAWLFRRRPPAGSVLGAYLVTYGIGRFTIETFRGDADRGFLFGGALSTSQGIALLMVPLGLGLLAWAWKRQGSGGEKTGSGVRGPGSGKDKG